MLEYEHAIFLQQSPTLCRHDDIRYLRQLLKSVWRIGKDKVELLMTRLQEPEHVATYQRMAIRGIAKFLHTLAYEGGVVAVGLNTYHLRTSSRQHLQRYAARTGKEVKCHCTVKVNITRKDIKNILLGKVGSRTSLERAWHIKAAAFILSCYYSHRVSIKSPTLPPPRGGAGGMLLLFVFRTITH